MIVVQVALSHKFRPDFTHRRVKTGAHYVNNNLTVVVKYILIFNIIKIKLKN